MGIDHIVLALEQNTANRDHALEIFDQPTHRDGVYGEAVFTQTRHQLGLRLTHGLDMVAARAHGVHFFENAVLLPTKGDSRLGMEYA